MANTLNVNTLPEYIEANRDELLVKAIAGAKTLDYIEIMAGVKHKDALNYLDSEVVLAEGECGWNPAGSDTFTQKYIEVVPVSVQKEFCWLDMKEKYMNHQLRFQAGRETLPFEQKIAESNMNAIAEELEKQIWQGDGSPITGFFSLFKDEDVAVVEAAEGATVTEKVDALVAAATATMLKKGVNIFLSPTDFRNYVMESNGTCCANRPILDAAAESITYAGDSRIKLIPVAGLEGVTSIVAATPDALVYGTDIEGSENVYRMWYDEKERKFDFDVLFNAGVALKYVDEIVYTA